MASTHCPTHWRTFGCWRMLVKIKVTVLSITTVSITAWETDRVALQPGMVARPLNCSTLQGGRVQGQEGVQRCLPPAHGASTLPLNYTPCPKGLLNIDLVSCNLAVLISPRFFFLTYYLGLSTKPYIFPIISSVLHMLSEVSVMAGLKSLTNSPSISVTSVLLSFLIQAKWLTVLN